MSQLDHRVGSVIVDPEAELRWFQAFDGTDEVVDQHLTLDRLNAALAATAHTLGSSRSRRKARALTFAAVCSLAAGGYGLPDQLMVLLAQTMQIRPVPIATSAFAGDEQRTDGPSRAEVVALKLISYCRQHPASAVVRRTAFWLVEWHRGRSRALPAVVVNALGVAMGILEPETATVAPSYVKLLLRTRNVPRFRDTYWRDAESLAMTGRRQSGADHYAHDETNDDDLDIARARRNWYRTSPFAHAEYNMVRRLTYVQRTQEGLASMHDAAWHRFNAVPKRS